jgi:hypothetical protein
MTLPTGTCRLCIQERELTFEHIPPRSAFNNARVQLQVLGILEGEGLIATPGAFQQRGAGGYYLCGPCNHLLGRSYVPAYQEFVGLCARGLFEAGASANLNENNGYNTFRLRMESGEDPLVLYPSRIVKQALAMLLCVASPGFAESRQDLRDLITNRDAVGLPDDMRVGFCFFLGDQARSGGPWGQINTSDGTSLVAIEVAFPPMAWLLALSGTDLPIEIGDATPWADLPYDHEFTGLEIDTLVGFANTQLPGDYRTAAQIREHLAQQEGEL